MSAVPAPASSKAASRLWLVGLIIALTFSGCRSATAPAGSASEPVAAVAQLNEHLRNNNLQAFAHDAVPPSLRPALADAWRDGRSRWPLEELPFDHKIPGILATLSAPKAETHLQQAFRRQFANANNDIRTAARTLGMFGVKFLESDRNISEQERMHYIQLVAAISEWGAGAKLGDAARAREAITRLTAAARRGGMDSDADFRALGMDESLRRLGPLAAAVKASLRGYGLDLDHSLDHMTLRLESQTGDHALVRMRYPLAGRTIDTLVAVERIDGHWYLTDFLNHARAAATAPQGARPTPMEPPPVALPPAAPPSAPSSS